MLRELTPLAVAVVLLTAGAVRVATAGVGDGIALLSAGLIVLGYWLARQ